MPPWWMRSPMRPCGRAWPMWVRTSRRASSRRRRLLRPSPKPKSRSGGRSSRWRTSRASNNARTFHSPSWPHVTFSPTLAPRTSRWYMRPANCSGRASIMKLPHRRQFLHLAAGAAALPVLPRIAGAQAYPSRPVRIIVGSPPGGAPDILARVLGRWFSERFGQPFIIENRPGANGTIGTEAVVRAPPDGYRLLLVDSSATINATLYEKLDYNFIRDIAPVASVVRISYVMQVHPSFPAKTVPEFIAYAKANPGKIYMASPGTGTGPHVVGELFKMMAGVDLIHVPYRGTPAVISALLGAQVHVYFGTGSGSIGDIKAGRLRALAVGTAMRWEGLPDIPTIGDSVPGYEASALVGVGVPKNTPSEIINKLNHELNTILTEPKSKTLLAEVGASVLTGSPVDFGKLIAAETEKWAKVIKFAGIKPE